MMVQDLLLQRCRGHQQPQRVVVQEQLEQQSPKGQQPASIHETSSYTQAGLFFGEEALQMAGILLGRAIGGSRGRL